MMRNTDLDQNGRPERDPVGVDGLDGARPALDPNGGALAQALRHHRHALGLGPGLSVDLWDHDEIVHGHHAHRLLGLVGHMRITDHHQLLNSTAEGLGVQPPVRLSVVALYLTLPQLLLSPLVLSGELPFEGEVDLCLASRLVNVGEELDVLGKLEPFGRVHTLCLRVPVDTELKRVLENRIDGDVEKVIDALAVLRPSVPVSVVCVNLPVVNTQLKREEWGG